MQWRLPRFGSASNLAKGMSCANRGISTIRVLNSISRSSSSSSFGLGPSQNRSFGSIGRPHLSVECGSIRSTHLHPRSASWPRVLTRYTSTSAFAESTIFHKSTRSTHVSSFSYVSTRPRISTSTSTRIRHLTHINLYSTTPNPKQDSKEESFPLPLPRSLASSTGLFLLHLPIPPQHWPSHLNIYSTLLRQATLFFKQRGVSVNCIYDGFGSDTDFEETERYMGRLITPSGTLEWEGFDKATLDSREFREQVENALGHRTRSDIDMGPSANTNTTAAVEEDRQELEILVCTHGSRDCRCSDRGGALVLALRDDIANKGLGDKVKVNEIAHVGGHKYAANAIILPQMDMYSNLLSTDASSMVDHLTSHNTDGAFNNHWRGRYGYTESEQASIWESINPNPLSEAGIENTSTQATVSLTFKTFEGEIKVVDAKIGDTLLQVARSWDLPSMEGSCGGNLECSTCHLYIPPTCPIPEPTDSELDMLGYALGFNEEESRLGCQVKVDEGLGEWCKGGGVLGLPRY